ncbi:MAG: Cysteine desulfurase [Ignavibacteriae bacterium]|nr:MAG: Cysteine desulfurase [Ignavibacteriota bacterium]
MRSVYLDYAATTPLDPEVFDVMKKYFLEIFGNASSIHKYGQSARASLEESRMKIASLITAKPGELFFVSGGTEADNFAIKGAAMHAAKSGKNHIITSEIEHHAVLDCCKYLEEKGFEVTYLKVDKSGILNPHQVEEAIKPNTGLISIMFVNNELGIINPIKEISEITRKYKIIFHTDAVQALGKVEINVEELNVDLLSLSAHKIYGPKGIGAIYIKSGTDLEKLIHGGGQERGKRAGTENVPLAVGFAKAAENVIKNLTSENQRLSNLKSYFQRKISDLFPFVLFNGSDSKCVPHILNVSFNSSKINIDGEALLLNLDLEGVAVSSGSACTSGSLQPSHVILGIGRDLETAKATIRFSFGKYTNSDDLDYTLEVLQKVVKRIGKIL